MANMPTINGIDNTELSHSPCYSSPPQMETHPDDVAEGLRFLPMPGPHLIPVAYNNRAAYIDRMTEAIRQHQQQRLNEMALLPVMNSTMPFYFPATALTGIPAYDMPTIIGRKIIDSLHKSTPTFLPFVQSVAARSVILPGRRFHERIMSCPSSVRQVNGNSHSCVTSYPYHLPTMSYLPPDIQSPSQFLSHISERQADHNLLESESDMQDATNDGLHCTAALGDPRTSTVTTVTECAYDDRSGNGEVFPSPVPDSPKDSESLELKPCKECQTAFLRQNIATDTSDFSAWLAEGQPLDDHKTSRSMHLPQDSEYCRKEIHENGIESVESKPLSGNKHADENIDTLEVIQNVGIANEVEPESVESTLENAGDAVVISCENDMGKTADIQMKDSEDAQDESSEAKKSLESLDGKSKEKIENPTPKVVTRVKLPPFSPSMSYNFLKSIRCEDVGQRYEADPSKQKDYKFKRSESAADLPFSILTIREQREYLKHTEEAFVQDAPCYDIARMYGVETSGPLISQNSWFKCRECRSAKQKESLAVFCRFYGFRKLRFQNNLLCTAGFLCPEDCTEKDLQLWLPQKRCFWEKSKDSKDVLSPNGPLDQTMSDFILLNITKMFCDIILREEKAMSWVETDEIIFWKKPVAGVREMCDVCETTLFNMHWICRRCGYGICLDCYRRRMAKSIIEQETYDSDKSNCFRWARCTKGKNHYHSSMLPTQIIPSTCLLDLSDMVHNLCESRSITTSCPCQKSKKPSKKFSKLGNNLLASSHSPPGKHSNEGNHSKGRKRKVSNSSNDILSSSQTKVSKPCQSLDLAKYPTVCLVDLLSKETWKNNADVAKDSAQYRNWLCEGKLLQLTNSQHPSNIDVFKLHWKFGMPVLVSGVGEYLNMKLWLPEQLSREYGDSNSKNSLVNCVTGSIVTNMKIRDFWDGFENISQRLLDENKKTMILKLKDWPPTESFHDVMPEVFEDLMRALPLPEYTFINGKCNLASRLPHFFVKPDLGPKMYNAYGWVTEKNWKQGTTNLHLDVSDAVNIMVYVGIPIDEPPEAKETLMQIVSEGEVDDIQRQRALTDKPGALWHIFHVNDVDKIRKFIRKVCAERGETVAPDHDPIHDQQMYLDKELRHRLKEEYNVEGYAILQCQGDGVFIPAGAPHQVFNLHSCIKIAEDFVSPEHVDKCFALTNEFRYLSSTHSNHEDKLQIKNIIYHAVKDIVSSAMHAHCV